MTEKEKTEIPEKEKKQKVKKATTGSWWKGVSNLLGKKEQKETAGLAKKEAGQRSQEDDSKGQEKQAAVAASPEPVGDPAVPEEPARKKAPVKNRGLYQSFNEIAFILNYFQLSTLQFVLYL